MKTIEGGLGFGFKKIDRKFVYPLERNEHIYNVKIGNDVELGSIPDNGSWRNTEIGDGTKIDSMVKVAHNVIIGKHTWVAGGAVLCGSCEIGDYCQIGAGAIITPHIKIGNNCIVQAGAIVAENMPDDCIAKTTKAQIKRMNKYI